MFQTSAEHAEELPHFQDVWLSKFPDRPSNMSQPTIDVKYSKFSTQNGSGISSPPSEESGLLSFLENPLLFEEVEQILSEEEYLSSEEKYIKEEDCQYTLCDLDNQKQQDPIAYEVEHNQSIWDINGDNTKSIESPGQNTWIIRFRSTSETSSCSSSDHSDSEDGERSLYTPTTPDWSKLDSPNENQFTWTSSELDLENGELKRVLKTEPLYEWKSRAERITNQARRKNNRVAQSPKHEGQRKRRRGEHLWEFLLDVLTDNRFNPELIKWMDKENGVFKIEKSQQVAKLWGLRKRKNSMSYEYMSRAMRHYYQSGILTRVFGKRLTYQFGEGAEGWRRRISISPITE